MPETEKVQSKQPPKKNNYRRRKPNRNYKNNTQSAVESNAFSSMYAIQVRDALLSSGVFEKYGEDDVLTVLEDPMNNYEEMINIANYVYNKSGIVGGAIDYMTALPCLNRIVVQTSDTPTGNAKKNKSLMTATMQTINDKQFIRDALNTVMRNGIFFYYFETKKKQGLTEKYLDDFDVHNIYEINEAGINANIITLPWKYTRIVGKRNGRYVLAFDLRYFDYFATQEDRDRKLKAYPQEIQKAYVAWNHGANGTKQWVVLDNNKTMCGKIKCYDSEPWGRPLAITALNDLMYQGRFIDTKRHVLNEINHQVVVHELPEGERKGTCALTETGQKHQHETVKSAILHKNTLEGTSVISVAAGTKLSNLKLETNDIFDQKNEADLNNTIALDMGICASLLGSMATSGNYAAQVNNLQMVTAQVYTFVEMIARELNYVIDKNIIHSNAKSHVEIYYFNSSFVNQKESFETMKSLFTEAGGSMRFLIASAGIDPDMYLNVLKSEYDEKLYDWVKPHQTSYTLSKNDSSTGRPESDNPTDNTMMSRANGADDLPSPSD